MTRRQTNHGPSFDDQLVLFRYFLHELKLDSLSALSEKLNSSEYEGVNESGNTYFYIYIARVCQMRGATITPEKLRLYDENICRHTRKIGEKRGGLQWKYYQYIALLFTEMYLDRYFSDADAFCNDLNAWLRQVKGQSLGLIDFQLYTPDKLNKLAFMCATGSGKTLIMHINILQFLHYFKRAKRINSRLSINKIIVLAPNENMSRQHLDELSRSSIPAAMFEKDHGFVKQQDDVIVIDMNKLKEEGKVKTVSVDSFEQNNLVLVDEYEIIGLNLKSQLNQGFRGLVLFLLTLKIADKAIHRRQYAQNRNLSAERGAASLCSASTRHTLPTYISFRRSTELSARVDLHRLPLRHSTHVPVARAA